MLNIYCARCGEPWDTDHIRHDELWGAISDDLITMEDLENWDGSLTNEKVAKAFSERGWIFSRSIYAVIGCPHCKRKTPLPNYQERIGMVTLLAELYIGDEEAMSAVIEDALLAAT